MGWQSSTSAREAIEAGVVSPERIGGAIIGRNLLFPGDADPLPLSRALTSLVHGGASLEKALKQLAEPGRPKRAPRAKAARVAKA